MKEDIREFVKHNRRDFKNPPFRKEDVGSDPFELFESWFAELMKADASEPYAFTLATADRNGRPSARVVYMRDISEKGIVFYTNYNSHKGQDLEENPQFSANFFWAEFTRQVRFSGGVEKLEATKSDIYFASRPRESQFGAYASPQSEELENRDVLTNRLELVKQEFEGKEVSRPDFWGGYLLIPDSIEFWQGRSSRLHDRIVYRRNESGEKQWTISRLAP